jgi:dipeptidyl aminopeptidase/acylaminoacyl peptidase
MASRGYAVLQVNYRGSGGRGEAFIKSGFGQWGGQIQDDLADGVQWAIAEGVADKGRVCVFGISFGAYSAMMLPVRAPQMFRCAVGYAGVYDLEMLLRDKDKEDKRSADAVWRVFLGTDAEKHRRDSPVQHAGQIKLPVLLIHGSADDITPLAQGKAMRAALSDAGNPPEYLQVSSEGHGFFLPANKLKVLKLLETFFARHIGPAAPQ